MRYITWRENDSPHWTRSERVGGGVGGVVVCSRDVILHIAAAATAAAIRRPAAFWSRLWQWILRPQ